MITNGQWERLLNYEKNMIWFMDFVLPGGSAHLVVDDPTPNGRPELKEAMFRRIHGCKFIDARSQNRESIGMPPNASEDNLGVGFAPSKVMEKAAAAAAATTAASGP